MTKKLPYLAQPSLVEKVFNKIFEARRPERFTQDFLSTKLGFNGGNAMAFIPLLKKLGFLTSDGTPTPEYDKIRNEATRGNGFAKAIRRAFSELYDRNEYAHELDNSKLRSLIIEVTGNAADDSVTKLIQTTFSNLKKFSNFDASDEEGVEDATATVTREAAATEPKNNNISQVDRNTNADVGVNLSYTINLNLPETTNAEVFNAIFRALGQHILRK